MKLSRRDIVKLGVATGASTLLPDFLSAVDAETQYRVEGQRYGDKQRYTAGV